MDLFNNKNVLITGASKGIGIALVEYFLSESANVFAVYRNWENKSKYQEKSIMFIQADIREFNKIANIIKENGVSIDILINNAGIICYENLIDIEENQFNEVFNVNVMANFMLAKTIVKQIISKKRTAVIVNTLSFASNMPSIGSGIYAASKAALESLTKTMAAEWAPYGIRVNGYSPGVIETEMTLPVIKKNGSKMIDAIALHYIASTNDIVKAVGFLASDNSAYITGINLDVSGGKFIVQNAEKAWMDYEAGNATDKLEANIEN